MRRFSLVLLILLCAAVAATLAWFALSRAHFGDRVDATTVTVVPPRVVEPFKRIDVSGSATVELVQGTQESVAIAAAARQPASIEAQVRGDTLYIQASDHERWWHNFFGGRNRPPQIVVTFRELESIASAGTVRITAGDVRVPALRIASAGGVSLRFDNLEARELKMSGAGAIRADMAGRVDEQTLSISGAGEYRGANLKSTHATVTVAGAGRVVVNAQRTLNATISGAGSVEYLGNPEVTERISGAGRVRKRDAADAEPPSRIAVAL
jgi:Putative auto-transporter adhesin, head GIN domain